jgi:hypothetical protein
VVLHDEHSALGTYRLAAPTALYRVWLVQPWIIRRSTTTKFIVINSN